MGSEDDFSEYVASRWRALVRSAVLLGCSLPRAEDVVQTALTRCLVNWPRVQRADDRDAYVHKVLINTVRSSRRRRWTGERATAAVPDQAISADQTVVVDDVDAVLRALSGLSREHRDVVVLRYYAGLGEQQTAEALAVPLGTVKSRLSRALKALAEDPHLAELRGIA